MRSAVIIEISQLGGLGSAAWPSGTGLGSDGAAGSDGKIRWPAAWRLNMIRSLVVARAPGAYLINYSTGQNSHGSLPIPPLSAKRLFEIEPLAFQRIQSRQTINQGVP